MRTSSVDPVVGLVPAPMARNDQLLATELAAIPNTPGKQQGIKVGARVAESLIKLRSTDGSAAIPLAVTAPDPSYPGAHATISEAAATVLSAFYGDHQQLTVTSDGDPGVTRSFGSFQAAATEATLSRLFAGQHTMIDLVAGQHLGQQVAQFVLGHLGSVPAGAR